jgi:hypothetical protein
VRDRLVRARKRRRNETRKVYRHQYMMQRGTISNLSISHSSRERSMMIRDRTA